MATFTTTIDTNLERAEAFNYLSDFSNAVDWDPAVVSATAETTGPARTGSRYRISTKFAGRVVALVYEITEMQSNQLVVFEAGNGAVRSVDTLTFDASESGTSVTYEASLAGKGVVRLADPLLQALFEKVGRAAEAGLRGKLEDLAGSTPQADS